MTQVEKLANKISIKIASELSYDKDKQEIIEYGLIALLQTMVMMITVLILGLILGIFIETAVVCLGVSILRKYSGGAHASSVISCTVISAILCISFAFLGRYLSGILTNDLTLIAVSGLTYIYALFIIIKKVPVDTPNKPIKDEKKRHRLKIKTFIVVAIYFVISAVLFFSRDHLDPASAVLICLLISIIWQMSTLTGPGSFLVEGSDRMVYRMINLKGGHNNNEN
jgi:accessory gene regulator B